MHYLDLRSDLMLGAPDKFKQTFKKVGFSLEASLLQRLDDYAERKFKGNRSAAANYLLGALLKRIKQVNVKCPECSSPMSQAHARVSTAL